jgi:hypothetical protein
MPLHIGRVEANLDISGATETRQPAPPAAPAPARGAGIDIESLRPMVLEILREELASVQRQQG